MAQRMVLPALLLLASLPQAWGKVARIDLNGAIDPITAEYVVKSIERAEAEHAEFLLIRINTPGGFAM